MREVQDLRQNKKEKGRKSGCVGALLTVCNSVSVKLRLYLPPEKPRY
jgi:hypothetical protein